MGCVCEYFWQERLKLEWQQRIQRDVGVFFTPTTPSVGAVSGV